MSAETLAKQNCVPCLGGVPPLEGEKLRMWGEDLGNGWQIENSHHLRKEFLFKDFAQALEFTNRVGEVAEQQGHHPDIHLSWGKVGIRLFTHKIDGLTESDFILAAKIEELPR